MRSFMPWVAPRSVHHGGHTRSRRAHTGGGGSGGGSGSTAPRLCVRAASTPGSQPQPAPRSRTLEDLLTVVLNEVRAVKDMQATQGQTLGAVLEKVVCSERFLARDDPVLRRRVVIYTVDDLVDFCSRLFGQPMSKERLLHALASSAASSKLFCAVGDMMQAEAANLGSHLRATPSHPHDPSAVQLWLSESRKTLLAARKKGSGKAAWLTACKGLEAYAEAASASTDGTALLAFLGQRQQARLVVMLLAALATGRLYDTIEMDATPLFNVTDVGMVLDLLQQVKASPDAVKEGARQLQAQANMLLEAQALSAPDVLQHGPLHVVGTVVVGAGSLTPTKMKYWESVQLPVGGEGPAPKALMQLRIRR